MSGDLLMRENEGDIMDGITANHIFHTTTEGMS